jgi:hypothetical protein
MLVADILFRINVTLKMETVNSSETFFKFCRTKQHHGITSRVIFCNVLKHKVKNCPELEK